MEKKLTRREARENVFLAAFAATFDEEAEAAENEDIVLNDYGVKLLSDMKIYQKELDENIERYLKGWTLQRLPRVSLVAMRLALAEMLYSESDMSAIAINEAVELVKKYGAETDYQFVNGVLGAVVREKQKEDAPVEQC